MNDIYKNDLTYLGTRTPRNVWGLIASLIFKPNGHTFFINEGYEYCFSAKYFVKRKYQYNKKDELMRVDIKKDELEKYRGDKWSIRNNCFRLSRKILRDHEKSRFNGSYIGIG